MLGFINKLFGGGSEELNELIDKGAVIIDVRTPSEFSSGHAPKAVNIPLDTLDKNLNKIQKYNKPIILCCASGMRSSRAKGLLKSHGITEVHDAGSWVNLK